MKNMSKSLLAGSLCMLFAGSAFAAAPVFSDFDANQDDRVDVSEFNDYYADGGVFDTWDANADGYLDEEEYSAGLFDIFDVDDNEYIDDQEWESGYLMDDAGDEGFWDL